MSPLSQARLLMPLLEAIRDLLAAGEYAAFQRATHGSPYIVANTERGNVLAAVSEGGLYTLDAAGSRYVCDPHGSKDAREEWT
jgi:hypothetical protein